MLIAVGNALQTEFCEYNVVYYEQRRWIRLEPKEYSFDNELVVQIIDDKIAVQSFSQPNGNNNIYLINIGSTSPIYQPGVDVINELIDIIRPLVNGDGEA